MKIKLISYLTILLLCIIFTSCQKKAIEIEKTDPNFMSLSKFKEHNVNFFKIKNAGNVSGIKSLSESLQEDNLLQELRNYVGDEGGYYGTNTFDHIISDGIIETISEDYTPISLPTTIETYNYETTQVVNNAFNELTNYDAVIDYPNNLPLAINLELKRINNNIKDLGLNIVNDYSNIADEPTEGDMQIYNTIKFNLEEQANSLYATINSSVELDYNTKQSLLLQALIIKDNFAMETENAAIQGYTTYGSTQNITVSSNNTSPLKVLGLGSFLKKVVKLVAKLVVVAVATLVAMTVVSLSGDLANWLFPNNVYANEGVVIAGGAGGFYSMFLIIRGGWRWIDTW